MCLNYKIKREELNVLSKLSDKKRYKYILDNFFKVANKDITVYKVLKSYSHLPGKFYTPYKGFRIEPNTLYYQTGEKFIMCLTWFDPRIEIERGLHSFYRKKEAIYLAHRYADHFIVKAIIPKGSLYLKGSDGEIVSDQLLFNELTKIKI